MTDVAWSITLFIFGTAVLLWGIHIGKGIGYRKRLLEELLDDTKGD